MKTMLDYPHLQSHFSLLENKISFFRTGRKRQDLADQLYCKRGNGSGYSVFVLPASVFLISSRMESAKISFRPDPDRYNELQILTEALWSCDLLILDDLGSEIQKDLSYTDLLLLLDRRQQEGLHTIITSNLNAIDLQEIYDKRIASRISGNFLCYKMPEVDLRLVRSQQ